MTEQKARFTVTIQPEWKHFIDGLTDKQKAEVLTTLFNFPDYTPKDPIPALGGFLTYLQPRYEKFLARKLKHKEIEETKVTFDFSSTEEDWKGLFAFWVQEKQGTKYSHDGAKYAFKKLKELSGGDFTVAKEAIAFSVHNKYQGFFNSKGLFYKNTNNNKKEEKIIW